jgi:hypothetical protein
MKTSTILLILALFVAYVQADIYSNNSTSNDGEDCRTVSLDFSNGICNSISEFDFAFQSISRAMKIFYDGDDYNEFDDGEVQLLKPAPSINDDGTLLSGYSYGASYSVMKGSDERRLLRGSSGEGKRQLRADMDCPPKEECNAEWCCLMCGIHCEPEPTRRHLKKTGNDICAYLELKLELTGCLANATLACTIL